MYPTKTITNKRTIPLSLPGKEPLPTVSLDPFSTLSTTTTNSNSTYATASFLSSSSAQQEIILSSFEKIQNCVVNYLYQLKRLPYIRFSTAIQECLNNLETMNRTIANHTISLQSYYRRNDPLTMTTVMTDDIVHISDQLYRQYIKYIADLITAQQIYAQHTIHILDILSPSSLSLPGNENFDPYEFHDGGHPELFQFYESLRSECDPNLVSILQDLVKVSSLFSGTMVSTRIHSSSCDILTSKRAQNLLSLSYFTLLLYSYSYVVLKKYFAKKKTFFKSSLLQIWNN